jgi:hypothetical protein
VLREYALVADRVRSALIGPRGDIVWVWFPRWHDDAIKRSCCGSSSTPAGDTTHARARNGSGGREPVAPDVAWRARPRVAGAVPRIECTIAKRDCATPTRF